MVAMALHEFRHRDWFENEFTLEILAKSSIWKETTHLFANPLLDITEDVVATLSAITKWFIGYLILRQPDFQLLVVALKN